MKKTIILLCVLLLGASYIFYEHNRRDSGIESSTLKLLGAIEHNFRYKVVVEYIATKDSFWCKHYAVTPFTYTRPSRRTFEYYPIIKNNKHDINLSLSEFSPSKGCQYRPIRAYFLFAPQAFEPLYKNLLLIDPQYINAHVQSVLNEPQFTSNEMNITCFPINQSARLVDDPNKHWVCNPSPKTPLMLAYDFNSNKHVELTLNIRTILNEEYRSSCFHWSAHHKEKCQ